MHRNPNPHMYCRDCGHWFWYGESFSYPAIEYGWLPSPQRICQQCSERENMPNIKITAEIDGKQVPLRTISTESFEAIKALEKSEEIPVPVARLADYSLNGKPRLLLRPTKDIILKVGRVYGLDLECGIVRSEWPAEETEDKNVTRRTYRNVRSI